MYDARVLGRCKQWYKRRWLRSVYPGWRLFRSTERAIAESAFDEIWFGTWYPWYVTVAVGAVWCVGTWLLGHVILAFFRPTLLVLVTLALVLPVAAAVLLACDLLIMYAIRPLLQRSIYRGLRRRNVDICTGCGYLMAGSPQDSHICPECGTLLPSRATLR